MTIFAYGSQNWLEAMPSFNRILTRTIVCLGIALLATTAQVSSGQNPTPPRGNAQYSEPSIHRGPAHTLSQTGTQPTAQQPATQSGSVPWNAPPNSLPSSMATKDGSVRQASFAGALPVSKSDSVQLKAPSAAGEGKIERPTSSWGSFFSVLFSLAIVLCVFLGFVWFAKKSMPQSNAKLPGEVVQVLGRSMLAPRQQVYVVRFGKKLLLVSQQPGQTQTLSEITDEVEVSRLAGICESSSPGSSTRMFADVLKQVATGKR
jgi:flagellar protein FliO/FliZ